MGIKKKSAFYTSVFAPDFSLISIYSQWSGGAGCSFWCNFPIEEIGKSLGIRRVQLDPLNMGRACFREECCHVRAMLQSCQSGIIPGQLC